MESLLVTILIVALIFAIVWWALERLILPEPIRMVIIVIVALIAILWLLHLMPLVTGLKF
jgi:Co/Zn/Cd efflux system component